MMVRGYTFCAAAFALVLASSCVVDDGDAVGSNESALLTDVTWTSTVGVMAVDNDLTKTAAQGWNAGAVSNETVGDNSFVQFTTAESDTSKMVGFSNGDTNVWYDDIDFAFYLTASGSLYVYEGGVNRGRVGSYAASDVLRIEVVGGEVRYLNNGALLYTSAGMPAFPLLVDTSLLTTGATINDVALDNYVPPAFWLSVTNVSESVDYDLTKTGVQGWNAGASTIDTLTINDGYAEFTTAEADTAKFAGLSNGDDDVSFGDIDFALYLTSAGQIQVREGGVNMGSFGSYAPGDIFRVQLTAGVVSYLKNGELLYTSLVAPTLPLLLDTALFTVGATINDVSVVETPLFQNEVGVGVVTDDLTKTGAQGWNSGASTTASFVGDVYTEFTTAEADSSKMAGLSVGDSNQGLADIDFAIYMTAAGNLYVYESGTNQGNVGTYVAGDILRVENIGGVVTYRQNGNLLYTSAGTPGGALGFDSSMFTVGSTLNDVTLAAIVVIPYFLNDVGVATSGDDLTKTGAQGWNSGASTSDTLAADGYVEFTTAEADTAKIGGLSNGDSNRFLSDVDFGFYMAASGNLYVYENGTNQGLVGTYAASDVLRVQNVGGTVTYHQNGNLLYTSGGTATSPLNFDSSMFTTGATLNDIVLTDTVAP